MLLIFSSLWQTNTTRDYSMTIPASAIVQVNSNVLSAGGLQLVMNGVFLTDNTRVPIGNLVPFSSADNVTAYFGAGSTEATLAAKYFSGYTISQSKPALLYFYQYNAAAVAAYLRGTSLAAISLVTLKTYSGTLTLTIDGVAHTTASISLAASTSFSDAASIIQAALVLAGFTGVTCTFDSVSSAFIVTSSTTGALSTISQGTGTIAANIGLTAGTLSQGAAAATPGGAMDILKGISRNWATFTTTFEPLLADKILFATWNSAQNNRFCYICWDTDAQAIVSGSTINIGAIVKATPYSGVAVIYNDKNHAAALSGFVASLDFTIFNNRPTFAFKSQEGLVASVSNETTADILIANGYNFYGAYATAAQGFNFLYPGQISGQFTWIDAYINQIWISSSFESTLMTLLTSVPSIPYNTYGYQGLIETSLRDDINEAINFGAIRVGVRPTSTETAVVNNSAGVAIDETLFSQGWYLQVKDPGGTARGNRESPVINFWYMDGGAVQKINMTSTLLQ